LEGNCPVGDEMKEVGGSILRRKKKKIGTPQ